MSDVARAMTAEVVERFARGRRRNIYIWGAGAAGQAAAAALATHGVRCDGYIDRDPLKAGTLVNGSAVYVPDHLAGCTPRPRVLVASMYWREISAQLRSLRFRPGRDFEVFPVDGAVAPPAGDMAQAYAVWRHGWRERQGLSARAPHLPPVKTIAMPADGGRRSVRSVLAQLPDGEQWVVLHDDRVRIKWTWRSSAVPADGSSIARAAYDWPPPPGRRRRQPFLLRALAHAAKLSSPILCRAWVVRACLDATGPAGVSLSAVRRWLSCSRTEDPRTLAGVCEIQTARCSRSPEGSRTVMRDAVSSPGLVEFATHIADSGLPVFTPEEVATFLPEWAASSVDRTSGMEYLAGPARTAFTGAPLLLVSHSRGNFFFREIRDFLAGTWRRAGIRVRVGDEHTTLGRDGWRAVVVAPHEFFELDGRNPEWDSATDLVLLNTEQPHTRWFARSLRHLLDSALVFDMNWQTSLLLRTLGVNAHFLPLGWDDRGRVTRPRPLLPARGAFLGMTSGERRLPDTTAWRDRPIDVLFVGTLSPRRADAIADAADALSRYRCFLHMPPSTQPITTGSVDSVTARDMADLCRRSKIVLNIHRDEMPYCEWHRVMFHAMRQGALVVTEPMMPVPSFTPGREFLVADLAGIPRLLTRLLGSPAGAREAARVAACGQQVLRQRFPAERVARRALEIM